MGYLSKYAVPFINRKSSTLNNVVNKVIKGGIGFLKIEIPLNPSIDNCIGFKIKVTSNDTSEVLFEGDISGSSSDGYKWIYASVNESSNSKISGNPTLFCSRTINESNENKSYIKSILLGNSESNWGSLITISIELLHVTTITNPDGNENLVKTNNLYEYESVKDYNSIEDGWKFSVGQINDESVLLTISKVNKSSSSSIILEGVINGVASVDESGNVVIETEFNGGGINLYDSVNDKYGKIIADGSELVGLDKNESLKGMTFTSTGFRDPIVIKSDSSSDVSLNLSIKDSGSTVTPKVNISKFNLGSWSIENSKSFSVKSSEVTDTYLNVNLELGGLGLISNGDNSELFVGLGGKNILVGSVKFCDNENEFNLLDKIDGRAVVYNDKLYVCRNGKYTTVRYSESLTMDDIKNGYFYEKINADAQLGGEIVRLKYDDGFILSNDIHNHIEDSDIHISMSDRNKWDNKIDSSYTYSRNEIQELIKGIDTSDNEHVGYHNPVNDIVNGDTDFSSHSYPYGHRILVKEYQNNKPHIRVAGNSNEWIKIEEFLLGDKVVGAFGNYREYININNKVTEITPSGSSSTLTVIREGDNLILST